MEKIVLAAVSRNYFNMPVWIAQHQGMFADEGLDIAVELYEGVDEVTNRLRDGRARLAYGITEHVILDSEASGLSGNHRRQCQPAAVLLRRGQVDQDVRRSAAEKPSACPRWMPEAPRWS